MARPWTIKNKSSFTYESVTGISETIRVGENGVTEEWIILLRSEDHEEALQESETDECIYYPSLL